MDANEQHCVGAVGGAVFQPLLLGGHLQLHAAQKTCVVEAVRVPDAGLAVAVGACVAGEPHRVAAAQGGQGQRLELVEGQVQGQNVLLRHVAQIVEGEGLVHRGLPGGGVVHLDVFAQIHADVFPIEVLRGQTAILAECAVLAAPGEVELVHRLAEGDAEQLVDLPEHFQAAGFGVLTLRDPVAELGGVAAEQGVEQGAALLGVGGLPGFGHDGFRHQTVFFDQVHGHAPVAAVADPGQNIVDLAVGQGLGCGVDDPAQEIVGLFQLVVEGQIVLGELKLLQPQLLRHALAQEVQGGEHPAAPALFLGGDAAGLELDGEFAVQLRGVHRDKGQIRQLRAGSGSRGGLRGAVVLVGFPEGKRLFIGQCVHGNPSIFFISNQLYHAAAGNASPIFPPRFAGKRRLTSLRNRIMMEQDA